MAPKIFKIKVTLVGITNIRTGTDGGYNLEIFGDVRVQRAVKNNDGYIVPIDTEYLWDVSSDDRVQIAQSNTYPIHYTAPRNLVVNRDEFVILEGRLIDHDEFNANDRMFNSLTMPCMDCVGPPQTIYVQHPDEENDQILEIEYKVAGVHFLGNF